MANVVCIASFNADLVSRVARPIARGETLLAGGFDISPGGKGSNAAIACARQGAKVDLVARIGDDDFGRMALDLWRREGIGIDAVEVAQGERSGVAQILVYDDGDNSIAVALGAGAALSARHIDAAANRIAAARVLMAPNEVPLAARVAAFAIARRHGVTTLLNPAPAQALPDGLLATVDILTPNQDELLTLAGTAQGSSIDLAAQALLARGTGAVLVTLGAQGCALYRGGHSVLRLPAQGVAVADTIGAGDTFTGALAATLARGATLEDAMAWANAAAALSVTARGAIGGMPTREAVAQGLSRGGLR
jgi:ribokinase